MHPKAEGAPPGSPSDTTSFSSNRLPSAHPTSRLLGAEAEVAASASASSLTVSSPLAFPHHLLDTSKTGEFGPEHRGKNTN
ncbi:unnamed protein product, partial [Rangifer tarandus platyrhynchus]